MVLDIQAFTKLRPYLFHATARSNLACIRDERALLSPSLLSGDTATQRDKPLMVWRGPFRITLRDQLPLQRGHVQLCGGWTRSDLIEALNARVFFWPGNADEPIAHGTRLMSAYATQDEAVLRIPFRTLLAANPAKPPEFCAYNSGAPRTTAGRKSPRGPAIFTTAARWAFPLSRVVEVAFVRGVALPPDTMIKTGSNWVPLWNSNRGSRLTTACSGRASRAAEA